MSEAIKITYLTPQVALQEMNLRRLVRVHRLYHFSPLTQNNKNFTSLQSFVWARRRSHLTAPSLSIVSLLLELLVVKLGYFSVSCLSQDKVRYVIHLVRFLRTD